MAASVTGIGTTETLLLNLPVAANSVAVGTTWRVIGYGRTSAAFVTPTMKIRFGTAGTVADGLILTQAGGSVTASSTGFVFEALVTVRKIGATGTVWADGAVGASGAGPTVTPTTAAVAVDTTAAGYLDVTMTSSAAAGITVDLCAIEVVKA